VLYSSAVDQFGGDTNLSKKRKNETPEVSRTMLEEQFATESDQFLSSFRQFGSEKYLASFVDKWLKDSRTWAREQIVAYLTGNLNLPGHEVVVRRIFKHFHAKNDHQVMGVLMVVFDRMVRRSRVMTHHYDWSTRSSWSSESLKAKPNKTIHDQRGRTTEYKWGGKTLTYQLPDLLNRSGNLLFSHKTRNYFRRAAWRYFRHLSYRDPETYVAEICKALVRYRDADFVMGENIIDNWSLMHACYFHSDTIGFSAAHTNLIQGKSLSKISPAPYQPEAWKTEKAGDALVQLLIDAQSSLVRIWAIEFFQREHEESLKNIKLEFLIQLLGSPDPNLQEFAAVVFAKHPALPTLMVAEWLDLIENSAPGLLPVICDAMQEHVAEERLDNDQLIELTCARQDPVSRMGFDFLQSRDVNQPFSADELVRLADCKCISQTSATTPWALQRISERGPYQAGLVIDFFDSLRRPTRNEAMAWLRDSNSPGYKDAKLWACLIESPFDDVKVNLIELLNQRESRPEKEDGQMTPVWVSVILGVHRGGRTKPKAIQQLTEYVTHQPAEADNLLPVLAVALRSIRAPEMRTALASIVRLAGESAEMKSKIESAFPELEFVATSRASS
jgi:hypothetical protein